MDSIRIRGARTHNLKNLNLDLPRHRLIVITGLSGSGKSSLAFDTLYAEGQRRYVESLSAYARQFLQLMEKPDVDLIEGLSPGDLDRAEGDVAQPALDGRHGHRDPRLPAPAVRARRRPVLSRPSRAEARGDDDLADGRRDARAAQVRAATSEGMRLMILAPVVVNRKGEHLELFVELRAKGFARVRVDGKVYEIDAVPKLAKTTKHTIEVVVDRLKVREEFKQRLAESLRDRAAPRRRPRDRGRDGRPEWRAREHLFSAKFACPVCNYSLQELEPRLFSFNSPLGACPRCDGLGAISFFDPKRVVALSAALARLRRDPRLGPAQPVLLPAPARASRSTSASTSTARSRSCPSACRTSSCTARATRRSRSPTCPTAASRIVREHAFEGILPNLERRYRETDSVMVREELAKYLNNKPCPECDGTRLRREARFVKVGEGDTARPIYEISGLPLKGAMDFFRALKLDGQKAAIADRIVKEIMSRLHVPQQRRPRLPGARPLGGDAVGRRGAAHPPRVADRLGPHRRDVRARRAVDRPAPARQRPPARDAQAPARPRQQRHRRRARRGRDQRRRLRRRHGAGRGRARRAGGRAGHARGHPPRAAFADRASTSRAIGRFRSRPKRHAPTRSASSASRGATRQQPARA